MKNKQITTQSQAELAKLERESQEQQLPEQKKVFSVSEKIRKRVHNLPDPARPPLGYDEHKAFDRAFPYIRLPRLHPATNEDTVRFNAPELPANQIILGDNLEVLRTLPSESIDLIYIDPPFFSGRNYNVIWGDSNEVRSFHDIWEGGLDSYLIWLNARLWEMRRVLNKTGSIYVHCDWHASHYIKTEMDKIFGYENFQNEIVWAYNVGGKGKQRWARKHDVIYFYSKTKNFHFDGKAAGISRDTGTKSFGGKIGVDDQGRRFQDKLDRRTGKYYRYFLDEPKIPEDWWVDINSIQSQSAERIGYPTQKPNKLLERIIKASSNAGDVVADFFCGGGTTPAVAMKLRRRFIACDSSRIAVAVTLDRLVKIGEEMSGVRSNASKARETQQKLAGDKVPNINVSYLGVYPIDKFTTLPQEDFITFVLTCYGASRNTAEGATHGYRPPGQSEPILVGPTDPNESVDPRQIKAFFDEIKSKLEPDKPVWAKIVGWRFSKQAQRYVEMLDQYVRDNNLFAKDSEMPLISLELIPLRSKRFRERVLSRHPNIEEADFLLRFPEPPVIGDIRVKKIGELEYEFEAVDAMPTEEDGWLVNCQWDFDYQEGHFAADKDYVLSREKKKDRERGERFEAILTAKHKFEKPGEFTVACKVQDNLAGESIISKKVIVR